MKRLALSCSLLMLCFVANAQLSTRALPPGTAPFLLGVIDTVHSTILNENRVLNIYLPEGYDANDTARYPVVYLLDGSADEDFIHVAGLYQFNSFPWIDRVPKSIVVGIANVDRRRDFTFPSTSASDLRTNPTSGHSDGFIRFIKQELQPYIAGKYRASKERTIIGQSLGGLLATEILVRKPELFDHYIIISPSLWWSDGALLNVSVSKPELLRSGKINVYIGVGKEGLTPGDHPRVMEVDANVLAVRLQAGTKMASVHFDYLPEENHATIAHQALMNALRLLQSKADHH